MIVCQVQSDRREMRRILQTEKHAQRMTLDNVLQSFLRSDFSLLLLSLTLLLLLWSIDCCAYVWELTHFGWARCAHETVCEQRKEWKKGTRERARVRASSSNSIRSTVHTDSQTNEQTERKSNRERIQKYQKQKYPHTHTHALQAIYSMPCTEMPHSYGWFGIAWWGKPQLGFFFFFFFMKTENEKQNKATTMTTNDKNVCFLVVPKI